MASAAPVQNENECVCLLYGTDECNSSMHECICTDSRSDDCRFEGDHACVCNISGSFKCRSMVHICSCASEFGCASGFRTGCLFKGEHPCICHTHDPLKCKSSMHSCACGKQTKAYPYRRDQFSTCRHCKEKLCLCHDHNKTCEAPAANHKHVCQLGMTCIAQGEHVCICNVFYRGLDDDLVTRNVFKGHCKASIHRCSCHISYGWGLSCLAKSHKCVCRSDNEMECLAVTHKHVCLNDEEKACFAEKHGEHA